MKGTPREGDKTLLRLEDYMDFCDDPYRADLVIAQLNHIIFMHGFIRMHRRPKGEITSTLEAMELMQAARSTLEESISRCANVAVEEVRLDLDAIGWQECPVGSVHSVGAPGGVEDALPIASSSAAICCSATATPASAAREKAKRARKRKRAAALVPLLTLVPTGEASAVGHVAPDGSPSLP